MNKWVNNLWPFFIESTPPFEKLSFKKNIRIVGTGASVGGLASINAFFSEKLKSFDNLYVGDHLSPVLLSILTFFFRRYSIRQILEVEGSIHLHSEFINFSKIIRNRKAFNNINIPPIVA